MMSEEDIIKNYRKSGQQIWFVENNRGIKKWAFTTAIKKIISLERKTMIDDEQALRLDKLIDSWANGDILEIDDIDSLLSDVEDVLSQCKTLKAEIDKLRAVAVEADTFFSNSWLIGTDHQAVLNAIKLWKKDSHGR